MQGAGLFYDAMMPGGAKVKAEDIDESRIERTKAIILSMTKRERTELSISVSTSPIPKIRDAILSG